MTGIDLLPKKTCKWLITTGKGAYSAGHWETVTKSHNVILPHTH